MYEITIIIIMANDIISLFDWPLGLGLGSVVVVYNPTTSRNISDSWGISSVHRWCCAIFKPPFLTRRTMGISFRLLQGTSPLLFCCSTTWPLFFYYIHTAIIIIFFFTTHHSSSCLGTYAKHNLAWTLGSQRRIADTLSRGPLPYQVTIVAATENHGQKRQHTQEKSRRHRWISTEF